MTSYPTDLSDSQWQVIEPYLKDKRKRKYTYRALINAIFYLVKTGCQWRMLPHDFPKWQLVYYYFSKWKRDETIAFIQEALVEKVRIKAGKNEAPTVGIIDSQSVKSTLVSIENTGFDAAKKIKGQKRHIIVDTLGLVLCVVIQSASVQDRVGALEVVGKLTECWKKIVKLFADGGYLGKLIQTVKQLFAIEMEIVRRTEENTFKVLPKRWIVERTFAWLDTNRRTSKNYERYSNTSESIVHWASIRMMLNHF
jgi:putative transposase